MKRNNIPPAVNEKLAALLNRIMGPNAQDHLRSLLYLHLRENVDMELLKDGEHHMGLEEQAREILADLGEYITGLRHKVGRKP